MIVKEKMGRFYNFLLWIANAARFIISIRNKLLKGEYFVNIREITGLLQQNPVISWHEHVPGENEGFEKLDTVFADNQLKVMDTLGIDKIVVSLPVAADRNCPPEKFIAANDIVYEAIQRYPGRVYGQAFVNPGYIKETIAELERCVKKLGFVGVKLYHQYFMDDPAMFPLIEKCIELDSPILMHCAHIMDPETRKRQPRCSGGDHMANIARRYPEATFLMGHIGGGEIGNGKSKRLLIVRMFMPISEEAYMTDRLLKNPFVILEQTGFCLHRTGFGHPPFQRCSVQIYLMRIRKQFSQVVHSTDS